MRAERRNAARNEAYCSIVDWTGIGHFETRLSSGFRDKLLLAQHAAFKCQSCTSTDCP